MARFSSLNRMAWLAIAAAVLAGVLVGAYGVYAIRHDPNIPFLYDRDGAQWIRLDEPVTLKAHAAGEVIRRYRTTFVVEKAPAVAILHIQGMRAASVFLDGDCVFEAPDDLSRWKEPCTVDLTPRLTPGAHTVRITVLNRNGPACLIAYCPELGLYSGEPWEASNDGRIWTPAVPVERAHPYEPAQEIMSIPEVFAEWLPVYAAIFAAAFACSLALRRYPGVQAALPPSTVRWIVLGGWLVLSANNMWKLPLGLGFDQAGHFDYIEYIARTWHVPLASEGWQMSQAPLYYFISALLFRVIEGVLPDESLVCLLRIVPILCGAAQVELCYRTARRVFPARGDVQTLATVLGGLMPMNLYRSQYVSNEPLAGLLIGCVVLLAIALLQQREQFRLRQCVAIGLVLGLALLAKVTALLIMFPVAFAIIYAGCAGEGSARRVAARTIKALSIVFGLAGLIAGWYYFRNYIEFGRPFMGGWEAVRGIEWWQDPGYRTPNQLLAFGDALIHPIFSGVYSFWDGIYSTLWMDGFISGMADLETMPHWNYGFVLPGMWFALLPTLAILIGLAATLSRPVKSSSSGLILAALCVGIYFAALLLLFLTNPFYCVVKAFYALGALSSLALLGAVGFEKMLRWGPARPVIHALFACWAVSAYLGFFVW